MLRFFRSASKEPSLSLLGRGFQSHSTLSAGQIALDKTRLLYEQGSYKEALKEVTKIEENYPGCTKAAKYYRGKISVALLEQEGAFQKFSRPHATKS